MGAPIEEIAREVEVRRLGKRHYGECEGGGGSRWDLDHDIQ